MKKLYECCEKYRREKLRNLRKDICLNSLYLADYENRYNIDRNIIYSFFDGYLNYLTELMTENEPNYNDAQFFDYLPKYDKINNLIDWYYCIESPAF